MLPGGWSRTVRNAPEQPVDAARIRATWDAFGQPMGSLWCGADPTLGVKRGRIIGSLVLYVLRAVVQKFSAAWMKMRQRSAQIGNMGR